MDLKFRWPCWPSATTRPASSSLRRTARGTRVGGAWALLLVLASSTALAQAYTFGTYSWDQADSPDQGYALSPGTYSSAVVTALPNAVANTISFPSSTIGFDGSRSIGRLLGLTSTGTRPVNLPAGNNGTTARSGFELSWSGGRKLPNGAGYDFVVYESGTNSTTPEPTMVQVYNTAQAAWSGWRYTPAQTFELYGGSVTEGGFATAYDLSDFGFADGEATDRIRIVNLTDEDRSVDPSGFGAMLPDDNGGTSSYLPDPGALASYTQFGVNTLDPDPFYVAAFYAPTNASCGNGVVEAIADEQCDPGADVANDCCDANCKFLPDATTCDDGLYCTISDACSAGTCTGPTRDCADTNACTVDSCNDTTDQCVNDAAAANGLSCDDGFFCTVSDQCTGGSCGGTANTCDDGNFCTQDSCNEGPSQCLHDSAAMDGTACDDSDVCTTASSCSTGSCAPVTYLEVCGDTLVCGTEQCDDGGIIEGDGCSSGCRFETIETPQQKSCLKGLNAAAAKLVQMQGTVSRTCLITAAGGDIPDAEACQLADPYNRVDSTRRHTQRVYDRSCRQLPDFGETNVTLINDTCENESVALTTDVFGPDLTAATILTSANAAGASCQSTMFASVEAFLDVKQREFRRCKGTGLKRDTITSQTTLNLCLAAVQADDRGKSYKARARFASKLADYCTGQNLDTAFPGACVGATDFTVCIEDHINCRLCRILNRVDALSGDCDLFDDGQANASCAN